MIAERVVEFEYENVTALQHIAIEAAMYHLESVSKENVKGHQPIYINFDNCHGFCGCCVWVYDTRKVKQVATDMLHAFATVFDV